MKGEKVHIGEMIYDFHAALEQELAQGDALAQAELFKFFPIDETFEDERKRYIDASSLPLRFKHKNTTILLPGEK